MPAHQYASKRFDAQLTCEVAKPLDKSSTAFQDAKINHFGGRSLGKGIAPGKKLAHWF